MYKSTQKYKKITITFIVLTIYGIIYLSPTISSIDAAPRDPRYDNTKDCTNDGFNEKTGNLEMTCCWREPVPGKILPETYCQTCDYDGNNCGDKELQMDLVKTPDTARPPTNNEPVLENPETNQQPSIRSDEVIVLEDTTEKEFKQNPSTNEETKLLSEDFETDNADLSSDGTDSEQQTSFTKKGSGQNSPVPPECPKQGPIPPDCTMKPKF